MKSLTRLGSALRTSNIFCRQKYLIHTWLLSLTAFIASPALSLPLHANAATARTLLLNTVFLEEYRSIAQAAFTSSSEQDKTLRQSATIPLYHRAAFALQYAEAKGLFIEDKEALQKLLQTHESLLSKSVKEATPKSPDDLTSLSKTFDEKARRHLEKFISTYEEATSTCISSAKLTHEYTAEIAAIQAKYPSLGTHALLLPLKGWNAEKVQCLLLSMINSTHHMQPMELLWALSRSNSPLAKDSTIRVVFATQLLTQRQYAETLRVLIDLYEGDETFRWAYETVQKIFNRRQRGDGSVALQGL